MSGRGLRSNHREPGLPNKRPGRNYDRPRALQAGRCPPPPKGTAPVADLDPKFETRAELEAWAAQTARAAAETGWRLAMSDALDTIRRVTLAHSHLIGDT